MLLQLSINGFVAGAAYALIGVGFALIYNVAGFFHFAHGAIFTLGPYVLYLLHSRLGLTLPVSFAISVAFTAIIGCLLDVAVFAPLRRKKSSPVILLIASLGAYIIIQNVISIAFGDDIKTLRDGLVGEGIKILTARITLTQISIVVVSAIVLAITFLILKGSMIGKAMRATSCDAELSKISGVNTEATIMWSFGTGSALASIAGILIALDVDMTPTMGLNALMMGVVAVIIGGAGSIKGIALGALLLGMAQNLGIWKISSQWQDAIAFFILLLFLIVRPEGFMGRKAIKTKG